MTSISKWAQGLEVGTKHPIGGNVSTLNVLFPGVESRTESSIGYRAGRLEEGYVLALLMQSLTADDFHFYGTTMRSNGRTGLPSAISTEDDEDRPLVHDLIQNEYGTAEYRRKRTLAASQVQMVGRQRIAKILPFSEPKSHLKPRDEYPMGGGGLQWKLVKKCTFFIAMRVDENGTATTPEFSVTFSGGTWDNYAARAKVRSYLEGAPA